MPATLDTKDAKIISLQKSIDFMQKEHAHTLKSLHEEVTKLQARCSELTFQLAMETTSRADIHELEQNLEQCQKELREKTDKLKVLETKESEREEMISNLKGQLQKCRHEFETQLSYKNSQIENLSADNNTKSDEIARLHMSLRSVRLELTQYKKGSEETSHGSVPFIKPNMIRGISPPSRRRLSSRESSSLSVESTNSSGSGSIEGVSMRVPKPPLSHEMTASSRKNMQSHRKQQATRMLSQAKHRPASGRRLSVENISKEAVIDTSDILRIAREQRAHLRVSQGHCLPNIAPISLADNNRFELPDISDLPMSLRISSVGKSAKSSGSRQGSPEVEVLAVDVQHKHLPNSKQFNSYGAEN